jgi:hypothetical protein
MLNRFHYQTRTATIRARRLSPGVHTLCVTVAELSRILSFAKIASA